MGRQRPRAERLPAQTVAGEVAARDATITELQLRIVELERELAETKERRNSADRCAALAELELSTFRVAQVSTTPTTGQKAKP